jgi:AraC-like DNA-binding protein
MQSSRRVDVLTDMLGRSGARGAAFARSTVHGDRGVRFPAGPGLAVHAIVDGEVHVWTDDPDASIRLAPGDIVVVREAIEHHLGRRAGAPCVALRDLLRAGSRRGTERRVTVGRPDDGPAIQFFCGAYLFEGDLFRPLLEALPEMVHLRPTFGSTLRVTMDLLARELSRDEPGQQTLLDRLLDVALVQVLREHFRAHDASAPAWFRAMSDPPIGAALRALHDDPSHPWTVGELADEASLSRAAFARRFSAKLGVAPLSYLTDWRMALARERLRDTDDGLAAIAASIGYASEFSFAAAFKRHHGTAPGRWRLATRAVNV